MHSGDATVTGRETGAMHVEGAVPAGAELDAADRARAWASRLVELNRRDEARRVLETALRHLDGQGRRGPGRRGRAAS
jgi:hypothetical protein